MRAALLVAAVCGGWFLVGTAEARASQAAFGPQGSFAFMAAPGERNDVTITGTTSSFVIRDRGAPIRPGLGCAPAGLDSVRCSSPPTSGCFSFVDCLATVDLGDLDDRVVLESAILPSTRVRGGPGNDRLQAGSRALALDGGDGDDVLLGSTQGDAMIGGPGADLVDGRGGVDSVSYGGPGPVIVSLDGVANDGSPGEADDVRVERVEGTDGADRLIGGPRDDQLVGNGGADVLEGRGGNDTLTGGSTDPRDADRADRLGCGTGDDVARTGAGDVADLDCELTGDGELVARLVTIETRTVRASRKGSTRLTLRRVPPPKSTGLSDQAGRITGRLRLVDATGRAAGGTASFALAPNARASILVRLGEAARRRLQRAPGRRLELLAVRDITVPLSNDPPAAAAIRIVGALTVLAPKPRRR